MGCHGDPGSPTQSVLMTPCPLPLPALPHSQILTGVGWVGQPVVDGTEDSGREWLVCVEGGAGYPESQLVRPSEESDPRPPPVTWTPGGGGGGETDSRTPLPTYLCHRSTLLPRTRDVGATSLLLDPSPVGTPAALGSSRGRAVRELHPCGRQSAGRAASGCSPRSWHTAHE